MNAAVIKTTTTRVLGVLADVLAMLAIVFATGNWVTPVSAASPACPNVDFRATGSPSAGLPDCRAYEQVSPVDKSGFSAYAPGLPAQTVSSGEALEYLNLEAFPGALGNTALYAAHVATRTPDGWRTAEWTPEVPKAEVLKLYKVNYDFSADLSHAVLQVPLVPITPEATPYVANLFLRGSEGAYSWINSGTPAVSPETLCGLEGLAVCWQFADKSTFAGASSDFSHVLFESNAQLLPGAPESFSGLLYESTGTGVRFVGILPDGVTAAASTAGSGSSLSYASGAQRADRSVERAVSQDGSHVVFQAAADGGPPNAEQGGLTEVYERIAGTETIELSVPAPGATPAVSTAEPATFQTASLDGSRVFFTSSAELTTQSNTGEANNSEDLYEYDLKTQQVTDLTIDTNPTDGATGAMVQGVVDSSADGSYVYFVANGQLIEGKGVDGEPNLYMVHERGKPVFIATLSSAGSCNPENAESADSCVWSPFSVVREAYVTPDGRHLAFMSTKSLPSVNFPGGYNNVDQETSEMDSEVYLYTAPARPEGTGQLVCASCDLSGTQPIGNAILGGISATNIFIKGRPVYDGVSTPFHRARALSDDGLRLFYAAPASLAEPVDAVYEYEQNGAGSCANSGGCQYSLTTANGGKEDYFLGTNAVGTDAFIATTSRLVPIDRDDLRDVYDVRVDGGIAEPPTESSCHSGCHPLGSQLTPEALVSVATGPSGNHLPPAASLKCKRGFTRSSGKCVKVKKQKKQKKRKKALKARKKRRV
jgi:hypothetical protein